MRVPFPRRGKGTRPSVAMVTRLERPSRHEPRPTYACSGPCRTGGAKFDSTIVPYQSNFGICLFEPTGGAVAGIRFGANVGFEQRRRVWIAAPAVELHKMVRPAFNATGTSRTSVMRITSLQIVPTRNVLFPALSRRSRLKSAATLVQDRTALSELLEGVDSACLASDLRNSGRCHSERPVASAFGCVAEEFACSLIWNFPDLEYRQNGGATPIFGGASFSGFDQAVSESETK
jgi:hypothetical protein